MVIIHIVNTNGDIQERFEEALYSLRERGVCYISPGSICFKDMETAALATEIIKQKHVRDSNLDNRVDLETQYVKLKILSVDEMSVMSRAEMEVPAKDQATKDTQDVKDITDEDIITPNETEKYVVIRGRAGIGKTTLMQRLMWRWACGEWATHLKAIFLLNLRVLASIRGGFDLPYVLGHCSVYKSGHYGNGLQANWLKNNEDHIGFVLDGLDEVLDFQRLWNSNTAKLTLQQSTSPLNWCLLLMKRMCLPKSTLIITSRPFTGLNILTPTSIIEVMGLTCEHVMEFIEKNVNHQKINLVKKNILNHPILLSVSAITFYCAALCRIMQDNITLTEQLTTYTRITAHITTEFLRRSMRLGDSLAANLRSICQLAYKGLMRRTQEGRAQLIFNEDDLKDTKSEDVDTARHAGLFLQTRVPAFQTSQRQQVLGEFVHLSIQEFLAIIGLLMQSQGHIKKALNTMRTTGQFNMALLFLYGFAFDNGNKTLQSLCFSIGGGLSIHKEVQALLKDMICDVTDETQLLQMVHESQSVELARHVGKVKFRERVVLEDSKMTVVDVMALIFMLQNSPTTTTVDLERVGLDSMCMKEFSVFLTTNSTITCLTLEQAGIDDTGVTYLASALRSNGTLRELVLCERDMSDTGVRRLSEALRENHSLRKLSLASVGDSGLKHLANSLHQNRTLTQIEVYGKTVTDQGVASFATLVQSNRTLSHVLISSTKITDRGVVSLAAALCRNTKLRGLTLPWTTVQGEGVKALFDALEENKMIQIKVGATECSVRQHDRIDCIG